MEVKMTKNNNNWKEFIGVKQHETG